MWEYLESSAADASTAGSMRQGPMIAIKLQSNNHAGGVPLDENLTKVR
jgi:hypothetical protein